VLLRELKREHAKAIAMLHTTHSAALVRQAEEVKKAHADDIAAMTDEHSRAIAKQGLEITTLHGDHVTALRAFVLERIVMRAMLCSVKAQLAANRASTNAVCASVICQRDATIAALTREVDRLRGEVASGAVAHAEMLRRHEAAAANRVGDARKKLLQHALALEGAKSATEKAQSSQLSSAEKMSEQEANLVTVQRACDAAKKGQTNETARHAQREKILSERVAELEQASTKEARRVENILAAHATTSRGHASQYEEATRETNTFFYFIFLPKDFNIP
jgi:hypothetical protein